MDGIRKESVRTPMKKLLTISVISLVFPVSVFADRVITTTGKIIEGKVKEEDGNYRIQIESASLLLPKSFVKEVEIEGDMSSYEPKNDKEKEMLGKGFVKYRGQWLSKDAYQNKLKSEKDASTKRLEEIKKRQSWGNEWKKETKNFVFHSNASPEILDAYADLFEDFYEFYSKKFTIRLSASMKKEKMAVNIFRSRQDYVDWCRMPATGGYFAYLEKTLNLYHDFEDPETSQMILFHEGTHLINYQLNPDTFHGLPIWIVESMAEYFSNTTVEEAGSKRKFSPGQVSDFRLGTVQEMIKQGHVIPLEKILLAPRSAFNADYYACGWSFVHFLANHNKYSKGFFRFFSDVYDGKGMKFEDRGGGKELTEEEAKSALLRYIGAKNLEAVEKEWQEYVKGLKITSGVGYFRQARDADFGKKKKKKKAEETAPSDDPESAEKPAESRSDALALINKAIEEMGYKTSQAYFLRARIYKHRDEDAKCMEDLSQAIALNPTAANYYVVRAWLRNEKDDYANAENDLRIAMALDPLEPQYEYYLKSVLNKSWNVFAEKPGGF